MTSKLPWHLMTRKPTNLDRISTQIGSFSQQKMLFGFPSFSNFFHYNIWHLEILTNFPWKLSEPQRKLCSVCPLRPGTWSWLDPSAISPTRTPTQRSFGSGGNSWRKNPFPQHLFLKGFPYIPKNNMKIEQWNGVSPQAHRWEYWYRPIQGKKYQTNQNTWEVTAWSTWKCLNEENQPKGTFFKTIRRGRYVFRWPS